LELVGQGTDIDDAVAIAQLDVEGDVGVAVGRLRAHSYAVRKRALEVVAGGGALSYEQERGLGVGAVLTAKALSERLNGGQWSIEELVGHDDAVVAGCALAVLGEPGAYREAVETAMSSTVRRHALVGLAELVDGVSYTQEEFDEVLGGLLSELDVVDDPEMANVVVTFAGRSAAGRGEVLELGEFERLCEVAPARVLASIARHCSDTDREKIIATSTDWMAQSVAMAHLSDGSGEAVCIAVATNTKADVKARVAAVGRISDADVVADLIANTTSRLSGAARKRLGELTGAVIEPVLTGAPVDALAVPELHPKYLSMPVSAQGGGEGRYTSVMIDVDGTLLDDREQIGSDVVAALQEARRGGAMVALCTARPYEELGEYTKTLGIGGMLLICDKGSSVVDADTGALVWTAKPSPERARELAVALSEEFEGFVAETGESPKIGTVRVSNGVDAERVAADVARACARKGVNVVAKGRKDNVSVALVADKSGAIKQLAAVGAVDLAKTVYLGDGDVDVPAFEAVHRGGGTSVALANGAVRVLGSEYIDVIAPDNNSGGVAAVMTLLSTGGDVASDGGEVDLPTVRDYSGYQTLNPTAVRESLSAEGLGWVWEQPDGVVRAGAKSASGHLTYGFPSKRSPIDVDAPPEAERCIITEVVFDPERKYCVSALCEVDGVGTRPDGERYHMTLWTAPGVPPAYSKRLVTLEDSARVKLSSPVAVDLAGFGSWRSQ
jgi:HAD superfamily hydrolase (TIGR01484 family)